MLPPVALLLLGSAGVWGGMAAVVQEDGQSGVKAGWARFRIEGVEPKPADADSPLPVGFPGGTAPGTIEVKEYPPYRSAVARGERMAIRSGDSLFWSLFRHIERNQIAMTAPVINTYPAELVDDPAARGTVTMEFLYREPGLGKTGPDGQIVEVLDHPGGRYVCLGIQGRMDEARMREAVAVLRGWLAEHASEWEEAGPPRRLGYHGPMTPVRRRLWEVQIPIRPATPSPAPAAP
ncbi:MAG: hypothetical protein KatS3mg108_0367 [Isosphaeraceae bacterium]|jgi:hypothetical protein|nr:MAG: hypothetical protein KatS3mg108_0367 [Isosphaeraceae bacterium]